MVRLFAELLSAAECARASVTMGTTAPVGVVVSYGLCALMLHFLGWRSCFWSAAIVLLGASFAWLAITKYLMRVATKEPDCAVKSQQTGGMPKHRLSYLIIASGLPLILGACFLHSVLKDGMQTWIPTYITERYDISSVFSLMLTMGLPFINLLGILLSKWWASAPNRNEMHLVAILFGFTAVAAICMSISGLTLVWALILLALITTAMMGANIIFINVLPTRFSNTGYVSTIAGITNSSAYVGGAAASVAYGSIADYYGWDTLCVLWCVIAVAGVVISLLGAKRWLKYRRMETNNE